MNPLLKQITEELDKGGPDLSERIYEIVKAYYEPVKLDSFAEKFREIFPSKVLPTGKNFKSNVKDIQKKLTYFFRSYKYDPEVVLEAAKQYTYHAEEAGYNYIRTAAYFIYKQGDGSDLADWCEKVSNEEFREQEPHHRLL